MTNELLQGVGVGTQKNWFPVTLKILPLKLLTSQTCREHKKLQSRSINQHQPSTEILFIPKQKTLLRSLCLTFYFFFPFEQIESPFLLYFSENWQKIIPSAVRLALSFVKASWCIFYALFEVSIILWYEVLIYSTNSPFAFFFHFPIKPFSHT